MIMHRYILFVLVGVALTASSEVIPLGTCQAGRATFYTSTTAGACSIGSPSNIAMGTRYFAPNENWWNGSFSCGECIEIFSPKGSVIMMVGDLCPIKGNEKWCSGDMPHFDINDLNMDLVAEPHWGVFLLTWRKVACPIETNMKARVLAASQYWLDFTILDHIVGIEAVSKKESGETSFTPLKRSSYNTWPMNVTKGYPITFRVKSIYGEEKEFTIESVPASNAILDTNQQFSKPPPQNTEPGCGFPYKFDIYTDRLNQAATPDRNTATDWDSNGGLASLDWQSTDNPYDGQYCAAAVLNPWQEWWFATRGSIKLPNEYFEGVSFMIRASTTWDKLQFFLQNYGDNYIVNLGEITTTWKNITLTPANWTGLPTHITRLAFKNNQGSSSPTIYIDNFKILSSLASSIMPSDPFPDTPYLPTPPPDTSTTPSDSTTNPSDSSIAPTDTSTDTPPDTNTPTDSPTDTNTPMETPTDSPNTQPDSSTYPNTPENEMQQGPPSAANMMSMQFALIILIVAVICFAWY